MELLVVLAVMGVMMGLIGFTLLGGGGNELGAAQRELLGMVQKARAQSALSGRETRLIVWNDPEDEDKYHRYLEIVTKDANESDSWVVAGEGFFLTDGVYLVPGDESLSVQSDDWREDAFSIWSHDDGEEFKLNPAFKGMRKEGGSEDFIYMAFNGSGNLICREDSSGVLQPPKLVLAVGAMCPELEKAIVAGGLVGPLTGIGQHFFQQRPGR